MQRSGLLTPFKTRLPSVRSVVELAVQGQFAGESLAATGRPLQHVQRQARHRLGANPQAGKYRRDLVSVVGVDPHTGGTSPAVVVPHSLLTWEPEDTVL